jgi:uncharacterized alpha-E superfamily protein
MLSRTADHLFWMARYSERAENLARLLDVTYQMSLVPQDDVAARKNWHAVITLNSLEAQFAESGGQPGAEAVLYFMVSDERNPASIYSCLRMARENAHAVRGTLTAEMWETINATWIGLRGRSFDAIMAGGVAEYFEWVKERASLFRGATFGTMLQDEAFHFNRIGVLLERADNTARLLDVKYHGLAAREAEDSASDFYQWAAVLRALSAFEVYRKVYRDAITPTRVAELLIFNEDLPRSLHACLKGMLALLPMIANQRSAETERRVGMLYAMLRYGRIEDVFATGLHPYLENFMDCMCDVGDRISGDFLLGSAQSQSQ